MLRAFLRAKIHRGLLVLAVLGVLGACRGIPANRPPDGRPPHGLGGADTPQFVCVSSDDNGYSGLAGSPHDGGLRYFTELFARLRNPAGSGDARLCDGASPHYTFFVNTRFIVPDVPNPHSGGYGAGDDPVLVKRAWREAFDRGHEIAVHTHSHPHGRPFTVAQWEDEMRRSIEILTNPRDPAETPGKPNPLAGLGIPRSALIGFRAPFIEPADNGMTAAVLLGLTYDSSIEEGPDSGRTAAVFPGLI